MQTDFTAPSPRAMRANAPAYLASARRRRPGRVVGLAFAFAVATTATLGGAGDLFNKWSGGHYAADIIKAAIARA